jgi:ABC-type lipoprotein release transport system permease subunit
LNFRKLTYIIVGNLGERKARTATAVFVIAFAVAVVMLVGGLTSGFIRSAMEKAEEAFPPGMLTIKPRAVNVAMLSISTGVINEAVVKQVREMEGVEFAAPQLSLKMPLRVEGEIIGQVVSTDALVVGIDPVLVAGDVKKGFTFSNDVNLSEPVPAILPRYFLDMYNLAYSESMGLPKINESFALGKDFDLYVGESYLTGELQKRRQLKGRIVGLTSNPSLFVGALLPLGWAEELNRWYHGERETKYNALHVKVRDLKRLDEVTSQVASMNLIVESKRDTLEKINFIARAVVALTGLFAVIVIAIAAASIFNTFSLIMTQRRGEVGLLRAVGGTRGLVTRLFVLEVAFIGLIAGILGVGITWALLAWADSLIVSQLPKISLMPEQIFVVPWYLAAACVLCAVMLSTVASLPIILKTTRTAPASLIAEA